MKIITSLLLLLLLALSLLLTGCLTTQKTNADGSVVEVSVIDAALSKFLPKTFVGDIEMGEDVTIYGVSLTIRGQGLKHTPAGWTWTFLEYKRNGRFSSGWVRLGTPR